MSTGATPLFIRTPKTDSQFRCLKHGEQCPLYRGTEICLFRDHKEGLQIYTIRSVSHNSLRRTHTPRITTSPSQLESSTLTEEE